MATYHISRRRRESIVLPEGANPIDSTRGLRELFCVNYKPCLEYTIKLHWSGFDCGECVGRVPHEPVQRDSNYE